MIESDIIARILSIGTSANTVSGPVADATIERTGFPAVLIYKQKEDPAGDGFDDDLIVVRIAVEIIADGAAAQELVQAELKAALKGFVPPGYVTGMVYAGCTLKSISGSRMTYSQMWDASTCL